MPKLSGNKGEWSEIYVFLRLLEIKKLYAADSQFNKKDDMFYNIINIIRTEPVGKLEFRINRTEDTITVFNTSDSTELLTLPCSEFKNAADRLYCEIIETNASAFALPDTEEFLDTLNIGVLKAKSTDKADIRIKIHDINTGYETVQGFSIKSRLGSPSTLVNAGKTTNFVFEVTGNIDDAVVQEFNTCSKKFKDRFEVLDRNGCDISYDSMENDVFESNLQLIDGDSTLNTSALTGESVPRSVKVGDEIISGCINLTGVLRIKTTKEFGDSTVSKILDLVENSSMKKSKSENFITKFARYYTPAVCGGALLLAILPPIIRLVSGTGAMWGEWITRALTFLVISCPCALVISIPLSFFAGIGCASANGVLVKGSNYLEALSDTQYVVFDKTGTLTKGVFEVTGIYPANNFDKDALIRLAAFAESASSHPISVSLKKNYGKEINIDEVSDIQEIAGHGVSALVDGKRVFAGNIKLMKKENIAVECEHDEGTVVYVSCDGEYAGCIVISDVIKENSKKAISSLKKSGIDKTVMLTGDSKQAAERVAKSLGLDEYHAELLPADKVEWVEKLLSQKSAKKKLAFVGDGINDAPVLSRADIGIAMGALGSDAAIEAADIVLMDDDPSKIALARKISVHTLKIVKENIVFALAIKAICLVLGALGIANMWVAIFADVGVMILAVLNAIRALKIK